MLTKREQSRYRAIVRRLEQLRQNGWTPDTHPDFEPLQSELDQLGGKMTGGPQCDRPDCRRGRCEPCQEAADALALRWDHDTIEHDYKP